jgi:hypothetical protein
LADFLLHHVASSKPGALPVVDNACPGR